MGRPIFAVIGGGRLAAAVAAVFALVFAVSAAPHNGEEFFLSQPDGSSVRVIVWGDEFYQDVETPDGYTLVRGKDGWICYAELSADGSEYVSTGVRYTGAGSRAPGARKGLRINQNSVREKQRGNRKALGREDDESMAPRRPPSSPGAFSPAPPDGVQPLAAPKSIVGLTLLINFPDTTSNVSVAAMNDYCNKAGGYNNNAAGSPRDYYLAVSNGLLDYTNVVTPFVVVDQPKNYYDRESNYKYVPELIHSALAKLKEMNFDMSRITTEGSGNNVTVTALNVFYAGSATQGWANGIWPHQGSYRAPAGQAKVTINGIGFGKYQLSNLPRSSSSPPGIGTFVHENGHMIMNWPDLYSYTGHSNGVGNWCVMNSGSGNTPVQPNPYFRALAGWIDTVRIETAAAGTLFSHVSNSHSAYIYRRNAKESYYIEARRKTAASADPRNSSLPGSGLAVWHIHTDGLNTNDTTKGKEFPRVALMQADGRRDMENKSNSGDAADLFRASLRVGNVVKNAFSKTTAPAAVYHDGVTSNIDIAEVSDSGAEMTFKIGGSNGPPTWFLTVSGGTGGQGYYQAGAAAAIAAPAENAAGRYFVRWTSAALEPEDIYALTTTVTMPAAEAEVTANFARGFSLPGQIEADTGYLQGVRNAANTNATGGRIAQITDTARYAEYAVNIAAAGTYGLSYRLLTSRNSAGRFRLLDVTGGVALDTVTVPTTNSNTAALQTVGGKSVSLKQGRAVWRFEPISGAYGIDWFAALSSPASVTQNRAGAPLAYGIKAASSGGVRFQVPGAGHVSVRVYDMRGRAVAVLCDGVMNPGVYNVNVWGEGLSRGLYVVRMKSGGYLRDVKFSYNR